MTQELPSPPAPIAEAPPTQTSSGGDFRIYIHSPRFPNVAHDTTIRVADIWKREAHYRAGELDYYLRLAHPAKAGILVDFSISAVFTFRGEDYLILYVMDDLNDPPDCYHTVVKLIDKKEVRTLTAEEFSAIES